MEAVEIPRRILTLTGHWPTISPTIFQRVVYGLETLYILSMVVEISNHFDDYQIMSEQLAIAVLGLSYLVKMIIFKFKSDAAQELISLLKLKEFNDYPKHLSGIFERTVKFSNTLGILYLLSCFITFLLFSLRPIFIQSDLPMMFSYDIGVFKPAIYAFQVMGMVCAALNNCSLDLLAISSMGICAAQIEILNRKIIDLGEWKEDGADSLHNVNADLCKCVKHHVGIIRFNGVMEEVLSYLSFAQYAASAITICNTGFQLVHVQPTSLKFMIMVFFLTVLMIQLVMYCWCGDEIIVKSLDTNNACYNFKWYESDLKTRKTLIIIMERSKKPLFLTAGKLSILSLQSFTSVMRTSYSYFTLMQTLYSDQD